MKRILRWIWFKFVFPDVVYEEFKKIRSAFLAFGYKCKLVWVKKINVSSKKAMDIFELDVPVISVYSYNLLIKDSLGGSVSVIMLIALTEKSEVYAYYASREMADCDQKVLNIDNLNRWTSMITILIKTQRGSEYTCKKPIVLTKTCNGIVEGAGVCF